MYYIYGPNEFINSTAFFINLYMHICRITKCDTNEDLDVSIAKLIEGSKLCVTIEHGLVRFCVSSFYFVLSFSFICTLNIYVDTLHTHILQNHSSTVSLIRNCKTK